jgi:polar amino acid transport system substrate-binding protein
MKILLLIAALALAPIHLAAAEQAADPRVADFVQAGKVRVGIHSFYAKDPQTGELKAVSTGIIFLDVARMLGARMGVEVVPIWHPGVPEMLACVTAGECDLGFMGPDPSRKGVDFSPPFLQLDYTLLVPAGSLIQRVADADKPGTRIAAVNGHASTLTLSRMLKQAQLVHAATPDPTFEILRKGDAEAFASVRPVLMGYSKQLPGSRVLDDHYGANFVGLVVRQGQPNRLAYVTEFVEQAKASGLIQQAIDRSGLPGHLVARAKPD